MWRTCSGVLLLGIALFGIGYAARASLACLLYHQAKFGSAKDDLNGILQRCEKAHRLYPFNYRFCILAAENAYHGSYGVAGQQAARRLEAARNWTEVGLALNPYKSQLHMLKTRLLEGESPAAAAACWQGYVDWHFWEPYNHAVLVELYAEAGDFGRAMEELKWVRGSEYHDWALGRLRAEWKKEMSAAAPLRAGMPQGPPPR